MFRFLKTFLAILLLALLAAAGWTLARSSDPVYVVQEWTGYSRFQRYDTLITSIGHKRGVDPMLIKAVIWRESAFHPDKVGKDGERGLMQVTAGAAQDWAKQNKIADFVPTDLFAPETNIKAGTWYLKQALDRWADKDDPMTFALAEYNAGLRRVQKWIDDTNMGQRATAADLHDAIAYPGTKNYVDTILARHRYYKQRGHL